jgi:hypothetical protein
VDRVARPRRRHAKSLANSSLLAVNQPQGSMCRRPSSLTALGIKILAPAVSQLQLPSAARDWQHSLFPEDVVRQEVPEQHSCDEEQELPHGSH